MPGSINFMENKNLKEDDPDNPARVLATLKNRVRASNVRGKIVYIPKDRTKFLCPNHSIRTVIELIDSNLRFKQNKFDEFECSCGTIYIKE
jgi:hypothetical protein